MSNYSPHDTFVLHEFNESSKNLKLASENLNQSISIAATIPSQYKLSASEIDEEIIESINEINEIKRQIVQISQDAFNNITGITSVGIRSDNMPNQAPFNSPTYPGKVPDGEGEIGTDWYSCKVSTNPTSYDRYNFIAPDTVETFEAYRGEVEELDRYYLCNEIDVDIPQINPCAIPGIPYNGTQELKITYVDKLTTITRAPMYPDTLRAWYFENLENLNVNVLNPFEPAQYQTLSPNRNNLGIGITSIYFFNQEYNGVRNYTGSLGFFYDITGPSDIPAHRKDGSDRDQICGIRSQIDPLMDRINGLRARIIERSESVSVVKNAKTNEQLAEWSLRIAIIENNRRIGVNSLAIEAIEKKYD